MLPDQKKKRLLIYLDKICKLDALQILSPPLVSLARRACLKVFYMPCGYLNCLTRRGECQLCFHPNSLATYAPCSLTCSTCCRVHELCISLCLLFCIITIRLGDCLLQKKPLVINRDFWYAHSSKRRPEWPAFGFGFTVTATC